MHFSTACSRMHASAFAKSEISVMTQVTFDPFQPNSYQFILTWLYTFLANLGWNISHVLFSSYLDHKIHCILINFSRLLPCDLWPLDSKIISDHCPSRMYTWSKFEVGPSNGSSVIAKTWHLHVYNDPCDLWHDSCDLWPHDPKI